MSVIDLFSDRADFDAIARRPVQMRLHLQAGRRD
jgi:hypothetical protein